MDVKFTLGFDFPNLPYYMDNNVCEINCWEYQVDIDQILTVSFHQHIAMHAVSGETDWDERDPAPHRPPAQLVRQDGGGDGQGGHGCRASHGYEVSQTDKKRLDKHTNSQTGKDINGNWDAEQVMMVKDTDVDHQRSIIVVLFRNNAVHLFYDRAGFDSRIGEFCIDSKLIRPHLSDNGTPKAHL